MTLSQRLRAFIGSQVQVMTAAGMVTGKLVAVTATTIDVETSAPPGYPPTVVTININMIGFIRILV
ncbi:hypothetical protein [Salinithrix halophila]|uniref:Uncharacterized protein n=1 Tax=Salinithrix halophila TaxID=1485204 RepID=A0ABV8JJI6_9BACL